MGMIITMKWLNLSPCVTTNAMTLISRIVQEMVYATLIIIVVHMESLSTVRKYIRMKRAILDPATLFLFVLTAVVMLWNLNVVTILIFYGKIELIRIAIGWREKS